MSGNVPPPRASAGALHAKTRHAIVGPDPGSVVTVVCRSIKGKVADAYVSMSSGNDAVDARALAIARSKPFEVLVRGGQPVDSCRILTVRVDRAESGNGTSPVQ